MQAALARTLVTQTTPEHSQGSEKLWARLDLHC